MGGDVPTLQKGFKNENHAIEIFTKEVLKNLSELQEHGLFFSFTTDPMLPETVDLTIRAIGVCQEHKIPVKILTKCARFFTTPYEIPSIFVQIAIDNNWDKSLISVGFTLTGCDNREPNASPNAVRIEAMRTLHEAGFKTFASIEPIIDLDSSWQMIQQTNGFCDLFKVGLMSGRKYNWMDLRGFMLYCASVDAKFYFKDSFIQQARIERTELPGNCVGRDYNIFKS
jgi:hypothetical protein